MKQILAFLLIVILSGVPLFCQESAEDYLHFLSAADRETLEKSGNLTNFGITIKDLPFWESMPFADQVRSSAEKSESSIASESLFLLDKPEAGSRAELDAKVFKAFSSFSTMKGLLVYSESKKGMETFIFDSHRVDGIATARALPDPDSVSVPTHAEYFMYQKEEQFKDVYSRFTFDIKDDWDQVSLVNLTPMRYLFITLVPSERLHTTFIIVPLKDKLLVYGLTFAGTPKLFGLERSKQSSFSNRMKALVSWFSTNLAIRQAP
jgi:hypothetical protein